jgi:riboflavin synthase
MFTGLIESRGTVIERKREKPGVRLTVDVPASMADDETRAAVRVGDSVAVNGCCLTVVAIDGNRWSFQAGVETLSKTNLGSLKRGNPVNLERPLCVRGELGGHFVQGHVDGVGTVNSLTYDGDWVEMGILIPRELARLVVPKGSVAVDGISLTVVDAESDRFSVALIPHTLEVTTLGQRRIGDAVNIETDILAKYVQRLLGGSGIAV